MISWAMAWYAVKSGHRIDEELFVITGLFDLCLIIGSIIVSKIK